MFGHQFHRKQFTVLMVRVWIQTIKTLAMARPIALDCDYGQRKRTQNASGLERLSAIVRLRLPTSSPTRRCRKSGTLPITCCGLENAPVTSLLKPQVASRLPSVKLKGAALIAQRPQWPGFCKAAASQRDGVLIGPSRPAMLPRSFPSLSCRP